MNEKKRPSGGMAHVPHSSDDFATDKGYEIWLEDGKPQEMRCAFCERRTGFDMVGHPPGRHLSQAFTRGGRS